MKTFLKNNKRKLLLSCLVILLPILVGLLLWNKLPDNMTTHWGADGAADGQGSKALVVFLPSSILLAVHIFALVITGLDKNIHNQTKKAQAIIFWIIPCLSLFVGGLLYGVAFGMEMHLARFLPAFLGVLFALMGNYMPKIKQNSTLGIKITWTLQNEENWVKTHRFAGKVWFIGGLLMIAATFLPGNWCLYILPVFFIPMMALPVLYSYKIYKTHKAAGIEYAPMDSKSYKVGKIISLIMVPLVLVFVAVLMFTGDVNCTFGEASFTVDSIYYDAVTISYEDITSVEYTENMSTGRRTLGFASAKLSLGIFVNDDLGSHTRYTYNSCKTAIVIRAEEKILVINAKTPEATRELYNNLLEKTK
jgi:uncharacterized membrane protein